MANLCKSSCSCGGGLARALPRVIAAPLCKLARHLAAVCACQHALNDSAARVTHMHRSNRLKHRSRSRRHRNETEPPPPTRWRRQNMTTNYSSGRRVHRPPKPIFSSFPFRERRRVIELKFRRRRLIMHVVFGLLNRLAARRRLLCKRNKQTNSLRAPNSRKQKQNKRCKDKKKSILYKQMQQHEKVSNELFHLEKQSVFNFDGESSFFG